MKVDEFLVKCIEDKKIHWVDLDNGQKFEKCSVPWKIAKHGLCETLQRKVLKKVENDSFEPLVFKSIKKKNPKLPKKGVSFTYKNDNGLSVTWNFTPYEVMEAIKGLNDDLNDRELCVKLFAPRDVVKKLRYKLTGGLIEKIEKEIGGDKSGKRTKLRITTSKRAPHIKTAISVSGNK